MHKNTALLLAALAIIAALVVGIQVGRTLNPNRSAAPISSPNLSLASPSPVGSTPLLTLKQFSHSNCGVSFEYESSYTVQTASDSAQLTNATTGDQIYVVCANKLPRPPLDAAQTETATIAGVRATIYHDQDANSRQPVDVILFTHPQKALEIALFGFGETFQKILTSLKFI